MIKEQFKEIEDSNDWVKIEVIKKGWSTDKKYLITDVQNRQFVLRVADISEYKQKQLEYNTMIKIASTGINMSKPLDFGICNNNLDCYILVKYVKGEQVEIELPNYSLLEQYEIGYQAGLMLKKIHEIPTTQVGNWGEDYLRKIKQRVQAFDECGIESIQVEEMIQDVYQHTDLLINRTCCIQHGDYHVGNLIIDENKKVSVIDFNRIKVGDPYYEFNRVFISSQFSTAFASGQINGYFKDKVPDIFFQYIKFYTLSTLIGTIPWSLKFSDEDLKFSFDSIEHAYQVFNKLKSHIPSWYMTKKDILKKVKS